MQETSLSDASITETSFEKQISKAINDLFALKMNESIGFTMNLKSVSTILDINIFIKDIRFDGDDPISSLFRTFKKLNSIQMDFSKMKFSWMRISIPRMCLCIFWETI